MKYTLIALLFLLVDCAETRTEEVTTTMTSQVTAIPPTADSVLTTKGGNATDSTIIAKAANSISAEDKATIESFAQSGKGRNCASISVIKLAIRRYGVAHVFSKVDSSATNFTVVLQDEKSIVLTRQELHDVGEYDDFRLANDIAIYKCARFIYAVMAKNKFLTDNAETPDTWPSLISVVNQRGGYHLLEEDTDENFILLGLRDKFVSELPIEDAYSKSSVIVASCYHSAFGGMSYYDEYGDVEPDNNFAHNHKGRHRKCNPIQWVYRLVK